MPLDLADDVRRRVRRQLDAPVDVEAVDRLDEADAPDLDEILELLAAVGVAARQRADERQVLLDQLLARLECRRARDSGAAAPCRSSPQALASAGLIAADALRKPKPVAVLARLDPDVLHEGSEKAAEPERVARRRLEIGAHGVAVQRPNRHRDRVVGHLELDADLLGSRVVVAFEDRDEREL